VARLVLNEGLCNILPVEAVGGEVGFVVDQPLLGKAETQHRVDDWPGRAQVAVLDRVLEEAPCSAGQSHISEEPGAFIRSHGTQFLESCALAGRKRLDLLRCQSVKWVGYHAGSLPSIGQ
jgi:hypothetical protein